MDYTLNDRAQKALGQPVGRERITPPRRNENLRTGGGRKNSPGWTEQKRKTNRQRFNQLRSVIKTAVTVIYPATATPAQLSSLNDCNRNFCKEKHIPSRCVWEGPGYHQHIAVGILRDSKLEALWKARLGRQWLALFGSSIGPKSFFWKPDVEPDKIASYLSKTRKDGGLAVKIAYPWLTFGPCWEAGFRSLVSGSHSPSSRQTKPRKKSVASVPAVSAVHPDSPRYTVKGGQTPEKEREICTVCWHRWGKSLWAGSCKCNSAFPNC
jgi:hypothetical protein